jgi:phage baseplate assembly protein W
MATLNPRSYLGRGWKFPVRPQGKNGRIAMSEYEQDVDESIRIILATSRGERVMRPDFGCGIHDLVFRTVDTATLAEVEDSVRSALGAFESRIEVVRVQASAAEGLQGRLDVSIDYLIRGTNNRSNLVFPFYIKERG